MKETKILYVIVIVMWVVNVLLLLGVIKYQGLARKTISTLGQCVNLLETITKTK
jgi:hypothetical protein